MRQEIEEGIGISELRRAKEEVVQEVKKVAGRATEVVVDLKESGEGKAKAGGEANI